MEQVLEPMMNKLRVSREELQQKLGHDWSQMIQMRVIFFGATSTIPLDNNTRLSYLGFRQFCYTLPLDTVLFSNELDHIEIFINGPTSLEVPYFDMSLISNYGLDFSAHLIEFDLNKIDSSNLDNVNGWWSSSGDGTFISMGRYAQFNRKMGISGHYIQVPQRNGINRCTTDLTQEVCQAKCRIQQIEKLCNCSPTTWSMLLNPGSNNCTLAQYKNCLQLNLTGMQKENLGPKGLCIRLALLVI